MKKIKQQTIDIINQHMVEIISAYVDLRKKGASYVGKSPFKAERTPSFYVTPSKGIWKDFSSGKGGNSAIKFIMELEGLSFVSAVEKAAEILGIEIEYDNDDLPLSYRDALDEINNFFVKNLYKHKSALKYVKDRGVSDGVIKNYKIGYAPSEKEMIEFFNLSPHQKELLELKYFWNNGNVKSKFVNRIMFPIYNMYGELVGFSGRAINTNKVKAKYINSNDSDFFQKSKLLYGIHKTNKNKDFLIITEGQFDVLKAVTKEVENVTAVLGSALTYNHSFMLRRFKKIVTIFDGDKAGRMASLKAACVLCSIDKNDSKIVLLPPKEDLDSFLNKNTKDELYNLIKQAKEAEELILYLLENNGSKEIIEVVKTYLVDFNPKMQLKVNEILYKLGINNQLKKVSTLDYPKKLFLKYVLVLNEQTYLKKFQECYNIPITNKLLNELKRIPIVSEDSFKSLLKELADACKYKLILKLRGMKELTPKEKLKLIKEAKDGKTNGFELYSEFKHRFGF